MLFKSRLYILAVSFIFVSACKTKYTVVKSNREEYKISNGVLVDSAIIKTYLPYKVKVEAEMNEVIGYTDVVLSKSTDVPESVLGNFFADAVLSQAKKIEPNIDFAFPSTKGGLRNDISKGPIILSNIFELMPFENQLILFNLKGEDVLKVLKFIARTNGQPVSGLKMNIKADLPEQISLNGKPFDVNKNYWVLTSDYISSGGDDAVGFSTPIVKKSLGLLIRDALIKEVKDVQAAGKRINAKLDGRITKN